MKTNKEIPAITEQLMTRIRALPNGAVARTDDLINELGLLFFEQEDINWIHYALLDAARKETIYLETACIDSIDMPVLSSLAFTIFHETPCYWCCDVGFEDIMSVYPYISNMGHIPSCTYVEVPFGSRDMPIIGQVQSCGIYRAQGLPGLATPTRYITRIATKEEYDAQPNLESEMIALIEAENT